MVHKGMLESLVTLDVRKLESWQLDEVQAIWRDFRDRKFQPFYRCAIRFGEITPAEETELLDYLLSIDAPLTSHALSWMSALFGTYWASAKTPWPP